MLISAPKLCQLLRSHAIQMLLMVRVLLIHHFSRSPLRDQLKAGENNMVLSSSHPLSKSGRILKQGGFLMRLHNSPPAQPEGGCYSKMLYLTQRSFAVRWKPINNRCAWKWNCCGSRPGPATQIEFAGGRVNSASFDGNKLHPSQIWMERNASPQFSLNVLLMH